MHIFLVMYDYLSVRRMSVALLILNVIASVVYVYAAMPSWVIPIEQAQGIYTVTGEPVVWAVRALPIFVAFFLINFIWGTCICIKRNWRNGFFWITAAAIWVIAVWIDFSHH
jgi:hypothetical protein